jgi:glutaredoxin 3
MADIEIYTWSTCPFCNRAKALLDAKDLDYTEYKIDGDEEAREQMRKRADGRKTMPQIFINNTGIGGCDELHELEESGQLDKMLAE